MTPALVGAGVVVLILLVGAVGYVLARGSGDDGAVTTDVASQTSATPPSTTVTTAAPTTVAPPASLGDVRSQPPNLFCRDLNAMGFSYSAAVDYWRVQGQPDRMDADKNGIPCETVYPRSDVAAYWGVTPLPQYASVPVGLFCRDLADRGYSYAEAVAYWFATGTPDRMDADKNGIPCETVYPSYEVDAYWYG